ncbi:MAG: hypothetical protein PVH61_36545 [Candidatus Aminicenantes bacterium]|jgi:hypothetical protein
MLADSGRKTVFGRLEGPSPAASILTVIAFVETQLVQFSKKYTGSAIINEKGLTQELCILLNGNARTDGCPFLFDKEYMEDVEKGDSPQVDIGVISFENRRIFINSKYYRSRESFFSMEAKRLGKISKAREKEYLLGHFENERYIDCGGVERFKKEIHGKGLQYAAMIGYVQKFDFNYWHRTINSWIDDLIAGKIPSTVSWSKKDKLGELRKTPETAKFQSENSRRTGSIVLFHLWVNLVK